MVSSISEVHSEAASIRASISEAQTPKALQILLKRARYLVRIASQPGMQKSIGSAARGEYRKINKAIRSREKHLS